MTADGTAWMQGGGGGRADERRTVVATTPLGRGRRRLSTCRRCVVCGCVSWLLLTSLIIDGVQGKLYSHFHKALCTPPTRLNSTVASAVCIWHKISKISKICLMMMMMLMR